MKHLSLKLVVLLLVLPIVLAACGGDKVGNAEKFLEALADGDIDEAEKYVCDDEKDNLGEEGDFAPPGGAAFTDISCEEDGDDVKCTMKVDAEGLPEPQDFEMILIMDGDKVCDLEIPGQ